MSLAVLVYNPATGDEARQPVNEAVAQEFLDYCFRQRFTGRLPWLDDPEGFEQYRRHMKTRLFMADGGAPVPRKTWQEHAFLLRQGASKLSWDDTAKAVGKSRMAVIGAVTALEKKARQASAAT